MAKRRKYIFSDRATAENEHRESEQRYLNCIRALRYFYMGDVAGDFKRGDYRALIVGKDSPCGPYVICSYEPAGQSPMLHTDDAWEWARRMREWYTGDSLRDTEARQIVELADEVQALLNKLSDWPATDSA